MYSILPSHHISFSLLLSFFGPYYTSSLDDKCSFVPFAIRVGGEIDVAVRAGAYLMTGTSDVTTLTDIEYGKHRRTHLFTDYPCFCKNSFLRVLVLSP